MHLSFDHLRDSNALPMERIRSGELDWLAMCPLVFDGFHLSVRAFANAGNNLIVDHIIENGQWLADLVRLLASFDVFCVGVHCPLPELERRERQRCDRRIGEARTDIRSVHRFMEYDLEIDSTEPNEQNVEAVISAWESRDRSAALDRMTRRR